jgi:hypothetical protein
MKLPSSLQGRYKNRWSIPHQGTLSIRVGNAAIDGTYIGSMMGWRWTVVGAVVIVVVVVVVAVAIAATAHH